MGRAVPVPVFGSEIITSGPHIRQLERTALVVVCSGKLRVVSETVLKVCSAVGSPIGIRLSGGIIAGPNSEDSNHPRVVGVIGILVFIIFIIHPVPHPCKNLAGGCIDVVAHKVGTESIDECEVRVGSVTGNDDRGNALDIRSIDRNGAHGSSSNIKNLNGLVGEGQTVGIVVKGEEIQGVVVACDSLKGLETSSRQGTCILISVNNRNVSGCGERCSGDDYSVSVIGVRPDPTERNIGIVDPCGTAPNHNAEVSGVVDFCDKAIGLVRVVARNPVVVTSCDRRCAVGGRGCCGDGFVQVVRALYGGLPGTVVVIDVYFLIVCSECCRIRLVGYFRNNEERD